ncbi:MAG TPA: hypothetical protein VHS05_25635 [Pyrinomonadaceae bacterium]|jgi:hypothetical protein|nr:hypothetical protein [Pyrinomonadaceae bacterium]
MATISQRGAPAVKLDGNAEYKPPTASIATNGGQSGSDGSRGFLPILTAWAVAFFIAFGVYIS